MRSQSTSSLSNLRSREAFETALPDSAAVLDTLSIRSLRAYAEFTRTCDYRGSSEGAELRRTSRPAGCERETAVALICYYRGMTKEVTLRQAGGSVSATLPKDMADRLRLEAGDRVLAVETDRGILLTPYDPDAERALQVAARAAKKYRNALRELAK